MLNQEQQKASEFLNGKCCVVACAGSGKTSVLVSRAKALIEKNHVHPQRIIMISFNRSSKRSLEERVKAEIGCKIGSKIQINTFHSLGYKIIVEYTSKDKIPYTIISERQKKNIINDICIGNRLYGSIKDIDVLGILNYISTQKNNLIEPYTEEKTRREIIEKNRIYIQNILTDQHYLNEEYLENGEKEKWNFIYQKYEQYKFQNHFLDFDDLVVQAVRILNQDKEFQKKISSRCKYIMVDEAQDMNESQWRMLEYLGSVDNNIFVVGDPCQNIYMWRGASSNRLITFMRSDDVETIHLFKNYRSTNQIIDAANKLMLSHSSEDKQIYKPMISMLGDGMSPITQIYTTSNHEADDIINFIRMRVDAIKDLKYEDIAIISRTNAQLMIYETKLYNSGIPYHLGTCISALESKEIKLIMNYLMFAVDQTNDQIFMEIINTPTRMLGSSFQNKVVEMSKKLHCCHYNALQSINLNKIQQKGVKDFIECVEKIKAFLCKSQNTPGAIVEFIRGAVKIDSMLQKIYGDNKIAVEDAKNMLDSFATIAMNYSSIEELLAAFLSMKNKAANTNGGVNLYTIHQSKGLEYPVVFVIGVSDGLLPHKLGNLTEERRLFYVAITRAKTELYFSSIEYDLKGNRLATSPYLEDIFSFS